MYRVLVLRQVSRLIAPTIALSNIRISNRMMSGHLKAGEKASDLNNKEWKERLGAEEYEITREHGTEAPFTGKYYTHKEKGTYNCVCCGGQLFRSETKYESGSGWPSFHDVIKDPNNEFVKRTEDTSLGTARIEVTCAKCDAHLGHVFKDGPAPSGLRYCINSASLDFEPDTKDSKI